MKVAVTVDPVNEMAVRVNLRGYVKDASSAISGGIKEGTSYLQRYIETRMLSGQVLKVGKGPGGGALRRSLMSRTVKESGGDVGIVSVGKEAWYGKLHEFGFDNGGAGWDIRASGTMSARIFKAASVLAASRGVNLGSHRAMALRFKVGGRWIYRRSVHHPGFKERSFMRRGLREATPRIRQIIETRLRHELAARRKATP